MQMSLPKSEAARVDFPVRLAIRDKDIKRLRGERMNPNLSHLDTVVQLGPEDFETDDERLFAVDFSHTLASERGIESYGDEKVVPGKLVLKDIGYPVDVSQVTEKVIAFLKSGVAEGVRRAEAEAALRAQMVAVRQMCQPIVARYVASKQELLERCRGWAAKQKVAVEKLDEKAFAKLKVAKEEIEHDLPEASEGVYKELRAELEPSLKSTIPGLEWRVQARVRISSSDGYRRVERIAGSMESSLRATIGSRPMSDDQPFIELSALIVSPFFGRLKFKEQISLSTVVPLLEAYAAVRKDKGQSHFDAAGQERERQNEAAAQADWIKQHGSPELRAALAQKLPFLNLYARERFAQKCKLAGGDLSPFAIEVNGHLFYGGMLRIHHDPSTTALRLIGEVAAVVPDIGVGRVESGYAQVNCENDEVLTVPGTSIAPGCPGLYLWRKAAGKRSRH